MNTRNIEPAIENIRDVLLKALHWARAKKYVGYSKYDALNSPLVLRLTFGNPLLRLVASQFLMRMPLNLRPFIGVRKARNPKGMALFSSAYLNLYSLTGDPTHRDEAETLLSWLFDNSVERSFGKLAWGYNMPWQDVGFFADRSTPNRVVSCFVGQAILDAYEVTGNEKYLDAARKLTDFLLNSPKVLFDSPDMKCVSYVPSEEVKWVVMDVSALVGAFLARVFSITGDNHLRSEARRLIAYVADKQTDYGAWHYTHPPGERTTKSHDNYHTGFILDSILFYSRYSGDDSFMHRYWSGLSFYEQRLFVPDGAPRYMWDRTYPLDIHGAAQGIITFSRAASLKPEYLELSLKIAKWAVENVFNKESGYFYYQKGVLFTRKFNLMRWNQAWMCMALSELLKANNDSNRS